MAAPRYSNAGRKWDAVPDRVDIRDWFYQPTLRALPDKVVNCSRVPWILDQGTEGACTGFALAAVINFLMADRPGAEPVSPRMLYEIARRYDEWPGESYEGSSARGAMKGWVRHGVCPQRLWLDGHHGPERFDPAVAEAARFVPGGAFYRVMHRRIRDMHAALAEVGILYMTLMVHEGWNEPTGVQTIHYREDGQASSIDLPVIRRDGLAESGHAVAIVGYTEAGFIVQNSWGKAWGNGGFALLPYEDYLLHATDVWVAQVGVPVLADLWEEGGGADTTQGIQRARPAIPLNDIRPFTIDIGNNGRLSQSGDYWTTVEDIRRLFEEDIPNRTKGWQTKRVLLYLHGGLNSEAEVARRVIAYRDVMLANEIYPVHVMWETGFRESIRSLIADLFTDDDRRAGGVSDWLRRTREGLFEAKDWTLEMSAAIPGTAIWNEMKENAAIASGHPEGGMRVVAQAVRKALEGLDDRQRGEWELHVVGHSAGAIFAAHAIDLLCESGVAFKTFQLMAPAITVERFRRTVLPAVKAGRCPVPDLYVLSDGGERDDDVGPYGKSLLFLVSNAFEGRRATPILGMERYLSTLADEPAEDEILKDVASSRVVIAGAGGPAPVDPSRDRLPVSRSDTHGGFDNDFGTMNSILWRIRAGEKLMRHFTVRDLQF